jgi:hypothetical protein
VIDEPPHYRLAIRSGPKRAMMIPSTVDVLPHSSLWVVVIVWIRSRRILSPKRLVECGIWQIIVSSARARQRKYSCWITDTQIWAPQQASASSLVGGRNTLVAAVLPLALQNEMLFEATIAMTRAAWVIRRGSEPFHDKMLLRHRGYALKELRNSLSGPNQRISTYVLLTMSTLLTMNVSGNACL